ncbi:type II CAAX endopeptidase family protein [Falsihalocynthiibacter arcticus]|uniref:CPBP family intramembrane glutamic endopeptidase n=1 Tax=Falsihalocynthiibacter arcticus TaxID=1579316 RepID=UPI0030018CC0
MSYLPLQSFIAPARDTCQIWRTVAGIALTFTIYSMGLSTFAPLLREVTATGSDVGTTLLEQSDVAPAATLVILYSFGLLTLGSAATVIILHKRSALSLLGDPTHMARQFWRAVKAMLVLNVTLILLPPYGGSGSVEIVENLAPKTWALLFPLSLLGLLVQTSAEEIFFRGYLLQQLAARFSSPLVWMGAPTLVFALGHFDPANGVHAWSIVIWAGLFSLAATDLVARTGNLGAAIGLHFVNNAFAMLVVSYPGNMSGLSLFVFTEGPADFGPTSVEILLEYAMMGVSWLAIRLAVRR